MAPPKPEEPAKTGATGSSTVKPPGGEDAKKVETAAGPQGATRLESRDSLTEGPILDLKAKRVPDPAEIAAGTPPRPSEPSLGRLGYGAALAAGLLGGAIGAIGGGLLFLAVQGGVLGPPTNDARVAALEQKIPGLATRDALASLDKRTAATEQALKPLPEAVKAASDRASEALQKASTPPPAPPAASNAPIPADLVARIDALDQRVSALQEEPGRDQPADSKLTATQSGEEAVRIADIEERLKAIETKAEADPVGPSPELSQKVAALQADVETRTKANEATDQALGERLDQLRQNLGADLKAAADAVQAVTDTVKQAAAAGKAQAEEAAKSLESRLREQGKEAAKSLEGRLREQGEEAAKSLEGRLREQGERIAALGEAVEGSAKAPALQAALRAIAADRIAEALASGLPYADALASLRGTGVVDPKQLAALEPFAESGAPTASSLADAFRPIADRIAAARQAARAKAVAATGGIGDRLMSMAESVVQVKRVGTPAPAGTATPGAAPAETDPAAKVQEALDGGRIGEAAQAFAAMPEDLRAQAGDFGAKLTLRAEAAAAAQALQAEAFKGLSAPAAGR